MYIIFTDLNEKDDVSSTSSKVSLFEYVLIINVCTIRNKLSIYMKK